MTSESRRSSPDSRRESRCHSTDVLQAGTAYRLRPADTSAKLAVTARSVPIVTVHAPLPVHAPDQPLNLEPVAGAAASATLVPVA
jgi:hypothetical protein